MKERSAKGLGRPRNLEFLMQEKAEEKMKPIRDEYFRNLGALPGSENIEIPGFKMMTAPNGQNIRVRDENVKAAIKAGLKYYK